MRLIRSRKIMALHGAGEAQAARDAADVNALTLFENTDLYLGSDLLSQCDGFTPALSK